MSETELPTDLPPAVLAVFGKELSADAQRIWRKYADTRYREAIANAPNPHRAAGAVAHYIVHVMRSELTMWENLAKGITEISNNAERKIEDIGTKIADTKSERDRKTAAIDRQIEQLKKDDQGEPKA